MLFYRRLQFEKVAALAYRFLKLLRTWLGEIERATKKLTVGDLPAEGRRALAQLTAGAATWQ